MQARPYQANDTPDSLLRLQLQPVMQACDTCRRRKLKCDRSRPCAKCQSGLLPCTYYYKPKRKRPRRNNDGMAVALPVMPGGSPLRSVSRASGGEIGGMPPASLDQSSSPPTSATPADHDLPPATSTQIASSSASRCLPSQVLRRHVYYFLRHLFPIWPVVRASQALAECSDPGSLTPSRYCFLTALCTASSVQLKLDLARREPESEGPADETHECYHRLTSDYLLSEVLRTRSALNIAEEPDLDALLTSCFLFSVHANLGKHNQAWFYLSQSISFALVLHLHEESAYFRLTPPEAQLRRRIFWLLFIFERYAFLLPPKSRRRVFCGSLLTSETTSGRTPCTKRNR